MKLITNIKPRRDGTVVVHSLDGKKKWTFESDASGDLVADVDCDATVVALLRNESAYPANEDDFGRAEEMLGQRMRAGDDPELDDDPADDEGDPNGAPAESNTPRSGRGRKSKG